MLRLAVGARPCSRRCSKTGAAYNTAAASPSSRSTTRSTGIPTLPLEEQADAWGALDEKIGTEYFPIIPTAFRNDLFVFGERDRQPDR